MLRGYHSDVTELVRKEEARNRELEQSRRELAETDDIMADAGYGIWHIILEEGKAPRMQANAKMMELLGIAGAHMTEEEVYQAWYDRILEEAIPSVEKSVSEMLSGQLSENTYRWNHPEKGVIYVRCGGAAQIREPKRQVLRGYHGDVTELVRKEEAKNRELEQSRREHETLRAVSERALAASEAKSVFLSNMSHEIRTPINAILGLNEMILRESEDANILAYAGSIETAGSTLLGIINDILDFSKIEAGKMEIVPVDYELSSILNDLVNMIQTRADDKGITLVLEFDKGAPELLNGDEVRVKQVITNILTNAVKYTHRGSVTFRVGYERLPEEPESVYLLVCVEDTGIGIRSEDIQKLFHEFERIEEKRNRNIEGTGLGMNITQKLLALMGTSLQVESVYGEGSKFSFRLKQRVVKWDPIGNYEEAYRTMLAQRKTSGGAFTAPEADVLVVDDTPMNLLVFKSLLGRTRVRVHMADGGEEALALSRERPFDLIFLDHMMPVMDGIETLHALRGEQDNPNAHTPVVCLTVNAISGARERYLAEGFDDYLTKPIDSVKLEELLLHYLPAEKIIQSGPEERQEDPKPCIPELEALRGQSGLDIDAGIKNSGSAEAYLPLLQLFSSSLDEKIEELDRLCREEDVRGYTIKIHAMKSSARMIGAMELGEEAQRLEQAGGDGDWAFILERHEAYLQKLRALGDRLSDAFPAEDGRPDADEEMMEDALEEIRCAAEDRDGDRLMDVFTEMNDYRIPGSRTKLWEALSEASENGDYEEILKLLSEQG